MAKKKDHTDLKRKQCIVIFGKRYHYKKVQILQKQHHGQ